MAGFTHQLGGIDENVRSEFRASGRDVDGGYAEYMTVPAKYCYPIPEQFSDAEAARCCVQVRSAIVRRSSQDLKAANG